MEAKQGPSTKWALGPASAACHWLFYTSCISFSHRINVCAHYKTKAGNSEEQKEGGGWSVH